MKRLCHVGIPCGCLGMDKIDCNAEIEGHCEENGIDG